MHCVKFTLFIVIFVYTIFEIESSQNSSEAILVKPLQKMPPLPPVPHKKKKLLFIGKPAVGHLRITISLFKTIQKQYPDQYEFYFSTNEHYKKIVEKWIDNLNYIIYPAAFSEATSDDPKARVEYFAKFGELWKERDMVKFNKNGGHPYRRFIEGARKYHDQAASIIQELKPDLIFIDELMTSPVAIDQGIKYVQVHSSNPCLFGDRRLPPPRSALPGDYTPENVKLWEDFIEKALRHEDYLNFLDEANRWLKETNSPVNLDGRYYAHAPSPYLSVFNLPKELDYEKMDGNWVRIDSAVVDTPEPFKIPAKLEGLPGKLIYFSLGSMSSSYKPLMDRLLAIMGEIPHRFIISTGFYHDEYKLPANLYGEKYVNQLAVLQSVEVFISHGGHNSVTESCHFGVPMILFPLFGDQHNNGKRIEEKGCGKQFDPFTVTKADLEQAIDFCLSTDVKTKLRNMSDRMKKDNNLKSVCESIVNLLK